MSDATDHAAVIPEVVRLFLSIGDRLRRGDLIMIGKDIHDGIAAGHALAAERDALVSCLREMTDEAQAMGDVLEVDFGKYPTNTREILERHGVAAIMARED